MPKKEEDRPWKKGEYLALTVDRKARKDRGDGDVIGVMKKGTLAQNLGWVRDSDDWLRIRVESGKFRGTDQAIKWNCARPLTDEEFEEAHKALEPPVFNRGDYFEMKSNGHGAKKGDLGHYARKLKAEDEHRVVMESGAKKGEVIDVLTSFLKPITEDDFRARMELIEHQIKADREETLARQEAERTRQEAERTAALERQQAENEAALDRQEAEKKRVDALELEIDRQHGGAPVVGGRVELQVDTCLKLGRNPNAQNPATIALKKGEFGTIAERGPNRQDGYSFWIRFDSARADVLLPRFQFLVISEEEEKEKKGRFVKVENERFEKRETDVDVNVAVNKLVEMVSEVCLAGMGVPSTDLLELFLNKVKFSFSNHSETVSHNVFEVSKEKLSLIMFHYEKQQSTKKAGLGGLISGTKHELHVKGELSYLVAEDQPTFNKMKDLLNDFARFRDMARNARN